MKKLEEILEEIKKMDELLRDLEKRYEDEADERKAEVIWKRAERTEARLDKLIDKADAIREKEDVKEDPEKAKKEDPEEDPEEDEVVCPDCGGDLIEEEDGTLYCEQCREWFRREGE
jgi:uncharacterized protein YbaR (Trm112 family)